MFDIDDQRLAPRLSRHDREMVGIAGAADLDRIEADEPRRADARPEAEIARVAAADAVVEQRFGRFEVEAAVRSEERRVGKEGVSQVRSRWSPVHKKKKK